MDVASRQVTVQEVARDDECWFDDGNIVIIASGTIAFRVYKGLLAGISPVFNGLFSIPQSTTDTETMDGCPVVHITDPPGTFRVFLRVVFKPDFA